MYKKGVETTVCQRLCARNRLAPDDLRKVTKPHRKTSICSMLLHVGFLVRMKRTRSRCLLSWKELKAAGTSAPPPNFHPGGLANRRRCQATYATLPIRKAAPDSPLQLASEQTNLSRCFFFSYLSRCVAAARCERSNKRSNRLLQLSRRRQLS